MTQQGDSFRTRLFLWTDSGIFAGGAAFSKFHSHHAIQITYVLDGHCRIRTETEKSWRSSSGFVILPGSVYQADIPGRYLTFYVDVNHPLYWCHKSANQQNFHNGVRCFEISSNTSTDILEFHTKKISCATARTLLENELLTEFPEANSSTHALDTRIKVIIDKIDHELPQQIRIDDIAKAVHLSESRVMHLFRTETGTTIRQFILWRRLKLALLAIAKGKNLTEAAHVANFSDSAHLTRTFVTMFGFSPTGILAGPVGAEFIVCLKYKTLYSGFFPTLESKIL